MFIENFKETRYVDGHHIAVAEVSTLHAFQNTIFAGFDMVNRTAGSQEWAADIIVDGSFTYRVSCSPRAQGEKLFYRVSVKTLDKTPVIQWDFEKTPSVDAVNELIRVRLLVR